MGRPPPRGATQRYTTTQPRRAFGLRLRKVCLKERWGTESSCVVESGELAVLKPEKPDKDQPVLDYLVEHPGASVAAAAAGTGTGQDESNTRKQLKRLMEEGRVMTGPVPNSRARGWFIA